MSANNYHRITFTRLSKIPPNAIIDLMNDPAVRRHLPLAQDEFGYVECDRFVAIKERMWEERGLGPWAFVLDDEFIGWGGLQPEGDDVDLGLVLNQKYWGAGPALYRRILKHAFEELCVDSVTALLPPSRKRVAALRRLGFHKDGEIVIQDQRFIRYRLIRSEVTQSVIR
ncbi:N-acetyltransferase [Leptolyngbyaceae cyanobacterium CCMR0082]|uniref:N-acetyltransferase n=1 Tax=Adonisia turfae CCMR0082 TaxID=2304604 RepID=A0A6M0SEW0_9CYAN|nr:GNAT family N-acetyltransferase [Adonisia turfae]NEZ66974.1 N-acetyltransferase [Adonisia turfae CCMR0082]